MGSDHAPVLANLFLFFVNLNGLNPLKIVTKGLQENFGIFLDLSMI